MSISRAAKALALSACSILMAGALAAPAGAYPATIQVTQTNTDKVKRYFYQDWKSGGGHEVSDSDFARGRLVLSSAPYRIKESIKKKDQFVLRIDVANRKKRGAAPYGWTHITAKPLKTGGQLSDYAATSGIKLGKCHTTDLRLSASFGVVSAGTKIGKIDGCGHSQVKVVSRNAKTGSTTWALRGLRKTKSLSLEVYVETPAGPPPNWKVSVVRPLDTCTKQEGDPRYVCTPREITDESSFRVKGKS